MKSTEIIPAKPPVILAVTAAGATVTFVPAPREVVVRVPRRHALHLPHFHRHHGLAAAA